MLQRITAILILGFLVLSIGSIPSLLLDAIVVREYTYPSKKVHQETVSAIGKFQNNHYREIYIESPIIAESVSVSVGDRVEKGAVLATIDTNLTKNVLQNSISIKMQSPQKGWDIQKMEEAAQVYGVSGQALSELFKQKETSLAGVDDYEKIVVPSKIYAPISGVVTAVNLTDHVLTQSAEPVVAIAENTTMKVLFEVAENDIQYVSTGDTVFITTDASAGQTYTGVVTKIYPSAELSKYDESSQTIVKVEVIIENPDGNIKAGFSANGKIAIGSSKNILTIPYETIMQDEKNQEYVFIWENGKAIRRNIKTGLESTYYVEVIDGLSESDKVILEPEDIREREIVRLKGETHGS